MRKLSIKAISVLLSLLMLLQISALTAAGITGAAEYADNLITLSDEYLPMPEPGEPFDIESFLRERQLEEEKLAVLRAEWEMRIELEQLTFAGIFTTEEAAALLDNADDRAEMRAQIEHFNIFARRFNRSVRSGVNLETAGSAGRGDEQTAVIYTSLEAFELAKDLFLQGYGVENIIQAFNVSAALGLNPADIISGRTRTEETCGDSEFIAGADLLDTARIIESAGLTEADLEALPEIAVRGAAIMAPTSGAAPLVPPVFSQAPGVYAPFQLNLNSNESVSLNTGAVTYRVPIAFIPGRNGLNINLQLRYNSSDAALFRPRYNPRYSFISDGCCRCCCNCGSVPQWFHYEEYYTLEDWYADCHL